MHADVLALVVAVVVLLLAQQALAAMSAIVLSKRVHPHLTSRVVSEGWAGKDHPRRAEAKTLRRIYSNGEYNLKSSSCLNRESLPSARRQGHGGPAEHGQGGGKSR